MTRLRYLVEEIAVGLEVYCVGRSGGHTLKSAYVLCDDYTELASKLYLLETVSGWSDLKVPNNPASFKSYHRILKDVADEFATSADAPAIKVLHERMTERRRRRNEFFHGTHLLDLSVSQTNTAQAFVDLLDYGSLLFPTQWAAAVAGAPLAMETLEALVRLDLKGVTDPSTPDRVNSVFRDRPRNQKSVKAKGAHVAEHPADFHTMLSVIWGGTELRDNLQALL